MFKFVNSQVFKNIRVFLKIFVLVFSFFLIVSFDLKEEVFRTDYEEYREKYVLEIPAILLEESLCRIEGGICLERGVWLKFFDLQKRNFLLTGHSFFVYPLKAGVFYKLEEVDLGDYVYLYFDGDVYIYKIVNISIHDRYDLGVEDFKDDFEILRIYTCYPAWSNLKRLVIEGILLH